MSADFSAERTTLIHLYDTSGNFVMRLHESEFDAIDGRISAIWREGSVFGVTVPCAVVYRDCDIVDGEVAVGKPPVAWIRVEP